MFETYQGVGPDFAPVQYIRQLAALVPGRTDVVLIFDEVQAGFGRTGKFWAFEHYGVTPDLICCGKGISSSLPLSAVIGRAEIMDQFPPGSMTSTHTGNPVCCAAALASLKKIIDEDLTGNAARMEPVLAPGLAAIQRRHPDVVGHWTCPRPGRRPANDAARQEGAGPRPGARHRRALLSQRAAVVRPVGAWGQTVKIAPPLTIPQDALDEGLAALAEAVQEAVDALKQR